VRQTVKYMVCRDMSVSEELKILPAQRIVGSGIPYGSGLRKFRAQEVQSRAGL